MIKGFVDMGALHDEAIGNVEENIQSLLTCLDCNNVLYVIHILQRHVNSIRFQYIV